MSGKVLLAVLLLIPVLVKREAILIPGNQTSNSFYFYISKSVPGNSGTIPFTNSGIKNTVPADPASIRQSNWYAKALKDIAAREYDINYQTRYKAYSSPNRKQDLRAFYSPDEFSLVPRNDRLDKWKLTLRLKGIYDGKEAVFLPSTAPAVSQNGNKIQFNYKGQFITEYINSEEGVRQNFIIEQQPVSNPKKLSVQLEANKNWFVNRVDKKELHFAIATGNGYSRKITYNGLKAWDANGKELKSSFAVSGQNIGIDVVTAGAVYPITIDPISTTPNWSVESNQAGAQMGYSVSSAGDVNGDGYSDVAVGARFFDNGHADEGAVFVYHGSGTGLPATASWTVESNVPAARMGYCVNTAGDVNGDGYSDIIIGAANFANGQINEGKAYVYYGSGTGLAVSPAWAIESDQAGAYYGANVGTAGDVNGDGYSDILVGAPAYTNGQTAEGAAFVYHGSASGISLTPNWTNESNQANASYGATNISLIGTGGASAGDVNGDGYSDIIVTSVDYDNGQTDEGMAFVFHGSATGLPLTPNWSYESNQAAARLGNSATSAGDVNGDGYGDVIVGVHAWSNGETFEGRGLLFYGSVTGLGASPVWTFEVNMVNAEVGCAVACLGDVNNDGYSDIILGALTYSNGQSNEGAAYVFFGSATGLAASANNILESNSAGALYGNSVASAGDVNGDGYSDVIVGAMSLSNGSTNEGAAFVYYGSANGLNTTTTNILESNQSLAFLGASVVSAGDVNGDGYGDVIVGSGYFDNGQTDEGAAFVYHGSATGVSNTIMAQIEINQADARMGYSVACAGDVNGDGYSDVIVGAYRYTNGQINEGAAFVYLGSATGISTIIQAQLEINQVGANLGGSVSSAGDVNGDGYSDVIAGASNFSNPEGSEGAAFVYHGSATGINTTIRTQLESNQVNGFMGSSVACAGDVNGDGYSDVIIGVRGFANGQSNEGAAFVYHGSATGISTTIQAQLESNQVNAYMGGSVAGAGDVNGDGYSDVIVGASAYDNGQLDEGMAFVYHGSPAGIVPTIQAQFESNQVNAHLGSCVASAGDVNGDGYSDIVIAASAYANGEANEGEILVYHGSSTGINISVQAQMESNMINGYMGYSVASAGDVNGDGYSDIIAGVYGYTNGQTSEGAAFIYLGNKGPGKKNNLRLYNTDLTTPIQRSNYNNPNLFGAGLFVKAPWGRIKGRLVWEVKAQGQPFSGSPITSSTSYYDRQVPFTNLGIAGVELKNQVQKRGKQTKIRARVEYSKATAITGQIYGPWKYLPGYTMGAYGMNAVPLPLTLISFSGQRINEEETELKWITEQEINVATFSIERSTDGSNFEKIGEVVAEGFNRNRADYEWPDKSAKADQLFYRLQVKEKSGEISYSHIIVINRNKAVNGYVSPNPVIKGGSATLNLFSSAERVPVQINLLNEAGQAIISHHIILLKGKNQISLDTKKLNAGIYFVHVSGVGADVSWRLVIQP